MVDTIHGSKFGKFGTCKWGSIVRHYCSWNTMCHKQCSQMFNSFVRCCCTHYLCINPFGIGINCYEKLLPKEWSQSVALSRDVVAIPKDVVVQLEVIFDSLDSLDIASPRDGSRGVMGVKRPPFQSHIGKA